MVPTFKIIVFVVSLMLPSNVTSFTAEVNGDHYVITCDKDDDSQWEVSAPAKNQSFGEFQVARGWVTHIYEDNFHPDPMSKFIVFDEKTDWATVVEIGLKNGDKTVPLHIKRGRDTIQLKSDDGLFKDGVEIRWTAPPTTVPATRPAGEESKRP